MNKYIMEIMVSVSPMYSVCSNIVLNQSGKTNLINVMWHFLSGTASVIIALTDGELNTNQVITAQQEASKLASDGR